jgi:small subunit ribosomal protein S6
MKHYELLVIVKPTLTAEEAVSKLDSLKELLTKNSAEIKTVNEMGVRKLAYEIDKHERGNYFVFYFQGLPASMDEILRNLRLDEDVLRFLNVKFESKKEVVQWEKLAAGKKKEAKKEEPKAEAPKVEETKAVEPEAPKAEETPAAEPEAPKTEEK